VRLGMRCCNSSFSVGPTHQTNPPLQKKNEALENCFLACPLWNKMEWAPCGMKSDLILHCFQSTQNQYLGTWHIVLLQQLDETEPSERLLS
jgi:hypothetical protein